jgi:hypothetical protein
MYGFHGISWMHRALAVILFSYFHNLADAQTNIVEYCLKVFRGQALHLRRSHVMSTSGMSQFSSAEPSISKIYDVCPQHESEVSATPQ